MFFWILDQAGVGIAQSTFGARFHSTGRWGIPPTCAALNNPRPSWLATWSPELRYCCKKSKKAGRLFQQPGDNFFWNIHAI